MNVNNSLNSRTLNTYGSAINEIMVYRKLTSLIKQYNRLATAKGLPPKKIPIYTGHINDELLTRSINAILNDIDKMTGIKDRDDEPPLRYGVYDGAFPDNNGTFEIGSWTYAVRIEDEKTFLTVSVSDLTITEMPKDLPFNVIADNQDNILNIISMYNMFNNCKALTSIDLSNFNTSHVTDMSGMFSNCHTLKSITFGDNFNTLNVTAMSGMFSGCRALTSITFDDNFDTSNVTDMDLMFYGCYALTNITFGDNFNTLNADVSNIFSNSSALASITLYKISAKLLTVFPGNITNWNVNGTPLTDNNWVDSWGDGPVTFTRNIQQP